MVKRIAPLLLLWLAVARATPPAVPVAPPLQVHSSPAVAQAVAALVPLLREHGIEVKISSEENNGAAIAAVANEVADVAITTRGLTGEDQAPFPEKRLAEYRIGSKAVAILVPRDVWVSGVRSIAREKMRAIYEKRITNWKSLGGEDRPIKLYTSERGLGYWEIFAQWLYQDLRKAPLGKYEILIGGADARDTVEFNTGSIALAAPRWADGRSVFALAVKDDQGLAIAPTPQNIAADAYPLTRPVMVIFGDRPASRRRELLEFLLSPIAQDLLEKNDLLPLGKAPQP